MDRLETSGELDTLSLLKKFTFQYGQIRNIPPAEFTDPQPEVYIPVWIDQKRKNFIDRYYVEEPFTFQYGQIRNTI